MARKKNKNSKISYDGLGLTPDEDKALMAILKQKDKSLAQLKRELLRDYIRENS